MNQTKVHASLFSGFGAADLAATWMGWNNAFWCEIEDFPRAILSYWFPKSKGYGNIKETDFTPWKGKINVLTGGFPCQPFSVAGKRKGAADDRYLWPEMLRAIREIRPSWVIGENVGGIVSMVQPGSEVTVESQASLFEASDKETILEQKYVIETICYDLEQEGYSIQPVVIPACSIGAPHRRDRIFFIAHRTNAGTKSMQQKRENGVCQSEIVTNPNSDNAGRSEYGEFRCKTGESEKTEREREWIRYNAERDGKEGNVANVQQFQECNISFIPEEVQFHSGLPYAARRDWAKFPTQSPVCRGNDGIPFDVVHLTVPLTAWYAGSIKGYGNAIVPQVMFEIYKAIEEVEQICLKPTRKFDF